MDYRIGSDGELCHARSHKYIRREPNGKGGWKYYYDNKTRQKLYDNIPVRSQNEQQELLRRANKSNNLEYKRSAELRIQAGNVINTDNALQIERAARARKAPEQNRQAKNAEQYKHENMSRSKAAEVINREKVNRQRRIKHAKKNVKQAVSKGKSYISSLIKKITKKH